MIHFSNPKVQASIAANTYVISGHAETKRLQDLLPGILNQVRAASLSAPSPSRTVYVLNRHAVRQLGPDNLSNLKEIASQYRGDEGGNAGGGDDDDDDDDDDDVPDLVDSETFDESA